MPPKEKNGNEKLDPPAQMLLEAIIRAWSADALSEAAETAEKEKAGLEAGTAS
jgi:hypothetical protein